MASAWCDADSFEVLNCQEFYPNFLDPISEDVRKELIKVIHSLSEDGASSEGAKDCCQNILVKVEKELGVGNFVCEAVAKELSECLRKLDLVPDAIEFVGTRLERLNTQDFGTLLILGSIYELSGDYTKALKQRKEVLQLATLSKDPILISLSLVKQACDLWHLGKTDEARNDVSSCLRNLEESNFLVTVDQFPFTESVHRLIDLYKTLGYAHTFLSDPLKSAEFYTKALHIVEQDKNAKVHIFKLETQIASQYSNKRVSRRTETSRYALSAYEKIKDIIENKNFMLYHTRTIIHAMSRIAYSLQQVDNDEVLNIREDLYNIAVKYLNENHPEVARTAADMAYLCCIRNRTDKESEYTVKARSALEKCDNDLQFLKRHVRELSDAWKSLGLMYSNGRNLSEAERSFNEAIQVNKRVYGASHPRVARIYCSIGHLYKKFDRFPEAIKCFAQCKQINDKFMPDNEELRKQVKKAISICKNLEKKKYYY